MSCRFCGIEQHTVRVVANNAVVTYACGTSFFPTDHELGEPFDSCWSQSKECKEKATATNPAALQARIAALEAQNKDLRDRVAELDTERKGAQSALRSAYASASRAEDMRAAGNALARHVAEDTRGQTARRLVEAWEEAAR